MPRRDIITIGGSAGSVEALKAIAAQLPADLPAAVFIVIHTSPRGRTFLPLVLKGRLPAEVASDSDRIENGKIYVAPSDKHLVIASGHVHLSRGPKEGLHRPSINITFRSAATTYGNRVVGVLLSGMLDDGASGMWEISQHGGVTIVQDPVEAEFPSMPLNALADVDVLYKLKVHDIVQTLVRLAWGDDPVRTEAVNSEDEDSDMKFSGVTCPECRGPLYEVTRRGPPEFRCRVGHVLSVKTLLDEHTSTQERKLYECIVALDEGADLAEYTSRHVKPDERGALLQEAEQLRDFAAQIRKMVEERTIPSID